MSKLVQILSDLQGFSEKASDGPLEALITMSERSIHLFEDGVHDLKSRRLNVQILDSSGKPQAFGGRNEP